MQPVGEPRLDDAHAAQRPDLGAETGGGMRHLRGGRKQILLADVEQHLILKIKASRGGLLIIDSTVRLAVKELAVQVQPGSRAGREQTLGVGACATDPVAREQAREVERLPEYRREHIAAVDRAWV